MIIYIVGICILFVIIWYMSTSSPNEIIIKPNNSLVSYKYQHDPRFEVVNIENAEMYLIKNFLSAKECKDIISICEFNPSTTVSDESNKVVDIIHPNRTSYSCFFEKDHESSVLQTH